MASETSARDSEVSTAGVFGSTLRASLVLGGLRRRPSGGFSRQLRWSRNSQLVFGLSLALGGLLEAFVPKATLAAPEAVSGTGFDPLALSAYTSAELNGAIIIGGRNGAANVIPSLPSSLNQTRFTSIAIGNAATFANSGNATAIGMGAAAGSAGAAANALAIGTSASAALADSTALGRGANASNTSATAIGNASVAQGSSATAIGTSSQANGANAFAGGVGSNAANTDSRALGVGASASNTSATAIGNASTATGTNATAIGTSADATGVNAFASGVNAQATNTNAYAGGAN
ncbi:MAG: hypothetical protein ACKO45_15540, partial [Cyanobium sp.]